MIPKRIHYCWLSSDPFPSQVQACIDSWKQYMPDWEYILWDYNKAKEIDSIWLRECIEVKKWAFAADFIRLWALYHEGGVFLDTDVLVYQTIEPFLEYRFFIGREVVSYPTFDDGIQNFLTSHCFGSEARHPFLKLNLGYYRDRHFIESSDPEVPNPLRYDMVMMPYIQSRLAETWGYDPSLDADHIQQLKEGMVVLPSSCFGSSLQLASPAECVVTHLGLGHWREPEYWDKHPKSLQLTISYKIRWRVVAILKRIARRFDYIMYRIHPDGLE